MLSLYFLKFLPKLGSFAPQISISFSPAKKPATPPLFGMFFANSASDFAAVAEACTASASTPFMVFEYSTKYGAKEHRSLPNLIIDEPPVIQEVKPSIISAVVRIKTISANFLAASIELTLTESRLLKNGCASVINPARFLPILGKESDTSPRNPFIMLPAKPPKISPNWSKTFPPSPTIHEKPGICFNAPNATNTNSIPPITKVNPTSPDKITAGEAMPSAINKADNEPIGSAISHKPLNTEIMLLTPVSKKSLKYGIEIKAPIAVIRTVMPLAIIAKSANPFAIVGIPILPNAIIPALTAVRGRIISHMPLKTIPIALIPSFATCSKPGICINNPIVSIIATIPPMMIAMSAIPFNISFGEGIEKPFDLLPPFFLFPLNSEVIVLKAFINGFDIFHNRNAPPIRPTAIKILPNRVLKRSDQLLISSVIPSHSFIFRTIPSILVETTSPRKS